VPLQALTDIDCRYCKGPASPVLFAPTLYQALKNTPHSWELPFGGKNAVGLLIQVIATFIEHGFTLDQDKLEIT
jgi:hypothetical protein